MTKEEIIKEAFRRGWNTSHECATDYDYECALNGFLSEKQCLNKDDIEVPYSEAKRSFQGTPCAAQEQLAFSVGYRQGYSDAYDEFEKRIEKMEEVVQPENCKIEGCNLTATCEGYCGGHCDCKG